MTKVRVSVAKASEIKHFHRDPNLITLTGNNEIDARAIGAMFLEGLAAFRNLGVIDGHVGFVVHVEPE